jgi:hypothetical protein
MNLCAYSKSEILRDRILPNCPLGWNISESYSCQCRKRLYNVQPGNLRVLGCMYPNDWLGFPVITKEVEIDMSMIEDAPATVPFEKNRESGRIPPLWGEVNGRNLSIPVIGICGDKGSGKTLACLTIDPRSTTLIDVEDSSVSYNLPLQRRYSLYSEVKASSADGIPTPRECWEWFAETIQGIDSRVLAVDPITDLQQGLVDWVRAHPEKFGRTSNQYERASGLLWADVKSHLKMILGRLSRRVECFVFTSHMGTVWKGGSPIVGKMKAKGVDTFYELSSLYLFLHRNADPKTGKVPAAPVASIVPPLGKSRLAHTTVSENGKVSIDPILPPRMVDFTWDSLREFVASPPNYRKLTQSQRAESVELTDDDRLQIQAEIAEANREAESLKNQRLDAMKEAAERNAARKDSGSPKEVQEKTEQAKPISDNLPVNGEVVSAPVPADRDQVISNVKESFLELKLTKAEMVKEIWIYGGQGKKLAELSDSQLADLLKGLSAKHMLVDSFAKK